MTKQRIIPKQGKEVDLKEYDPNYTDDYDKDTAKEETERLNGRLYDLQEMLYAQSQKALLIILQAMDAGGKDSTIKSVFEGINPQGVYVISFKSPTPEEVSHDFIWRVHKHVPPKGYIAIFNRSHYEDTLIVRVNELVPQKVWEGHYDHINNFEKLLSDANTRILKFFLHISKDEQKRRFEERLAQPEKHWKWHTSDLETRAKWDAYMEAYEATLTRCNTDYAPWHIVPANHKWYRNLVITQAIVETMEDMKLAYPPAEEGLDKVVIPD